MNRPGLGEVAVLVAGRAALGEKQSLAPLGRRRFGHLRRRFQRLDRLALGQQIVGHRVDLRRLEPLGIAEALPVEVFPKTVEPRHARIGPEQLGVAKPLVEKDGIQLAGRIAQARAHLAHRPRRGIISGQHLQGGSLRRAEWS